MQTVCILYTNTSFTPGQIRLLLQSMISTTDPALVAVCALQLSVGVLATALMKTGSDMSYSMTSLPLHHAQAIPSASTLLEHTHTHSYSAHIPAYTRGSAEEFLSSRARRPRIQIQFH